MKPAKFATLAVLAAMAQALSGSPAFAAPSQSNDRAMTKLAAQIISEASAAHRALASGNVRTGDLDIGDALAARTSLAARARAAGLPMIVPIYAELDDTTVLTDAVKGAAAKGAKMPTTVRANAAQLTYLAIDLNKAKSHLDAAKTAVAERNDRAAEDSLAAVGSDLVAGTVITDLPLLTAREDLSRAQRELSAGDRPAAMTDLHQASLSLAAYTTGDHVKDARVLAAEIDSNAMHGQSAPSSIGSKIERWWSSVTGWVESKV
jgi:hypothetical protein